MSDYICNIRCSYRQPSGYCGSTGGYETCQYRQLHSKQTNADRIRAMSDEELADWLGVYCNGQTAQEAGKPCVSGMGSCEECWLDWLKQEAVSNG